MCVCLSVCLSVGPFVCLFVCPYIVAVFREAQKFVTATVNSALKGSGVGFFSKGKLEKYLVDEQLRHLVCTRILEASKGPRGVQVTDVVCLSVCLSVCPVIFPCLLVA